MDKEREKKEFRNKLKNSTCYNYRINDETIEIMIEHNYQNKILEELRGKNPDKIEESVNRIVGELNEMERDSSMSGQKYVFEIGETAGKKYIRAKKLHKTC